MSSRHTSLHVPIAVPRTDPDSAGPSAARRLIALAATASVGVLGSIGLFTGIASAEDAAAAPDEAAPAATSSNNGVPESPATEAAPSSPAAETTDPSSAAAEPTDAGTDPSAPASDTTAAPSDTAAPAEPSDAASTSPAAPSSPSATGTPSAEPVEKAEVVPNAVIPGDFGTGKNLTTNVIEGSGQWPDDADLSGATISLTDVTDPAAPIDLGICTTDASGDCGFSATGFPFENIILAGRSYEVTQLTASANALVDPQSTVTFTVPAGEVCQFGDPTCNVILFEQVGLYRTIGISKTSTVDDRPLAGATYVLCADEPAPPVEDQGLPVANLAVVPTPGGPSAAGCPDGTVPVGESTTDDSGLAVFGGFYGPDDSYAVYETAAPDGYTLNPDLQLFSVPAAASEEEAGETVFVSVGNDADVPAPTAVDDVVSVPFGGTVIVPAIDNDLGNGATPFLNAFGNAAHGVVSIVADPTCGAESQSCSEALQYTPVAGYSGPDSFTYQIATRGGTSTATVSISVLDAPVPPAPQAPPVTDGTAPGADGGSLAKTGVEVAGAITTGLGLIGLGALALVGAAATSRRPHRRTGSHA